MAPSRRAHAALRGLEGRVEAEVAPHFVVGGMGDLTRGRFSSTKEPLPFMPPARLGGLARWDNGTWSVGGEARHAFKQDRVPPAVSEGDPSGLATDAYTLLNLDIGYNITIGDRINSIALRVEHLTDGKYRDATSRIKTFALNQGRNVSLVYKIVF